MRLFCYVKYAHFIYINYNNTSKRSNDNMKCQICDFEAEGKKFSNHLKKEHKLSGKDYTLTYIQKDYSGCLNCGKETRYVAFSFKKYCSNCSKIAMKEGGRRGGKAGAWNKGKTKETDVRIKSLSGEKTDFGERVIKKKQKTELV